MTKKLDFYRRTSLWLLSVKNDVNVSSKRKKHKNFEREIIFVAVLKVTDEKIRVRTKMSRIRNTAFAQYMTSMDQYILKTYK